MSEHTALRCLCFRELFTFHECPGHHLSIYLQQFSAGDLLFSLTYSEERRVINGIILKATNLRKADIWGLAGIILLSITHLFKTPLHS